MRRFSANASKARQATSRARLIEKIKIEDIKPSSRQYPYLQFLYDDRDRLHRYVLDSGTHRDHHADQLGDAGPRTRS